MLNACKCPDQNIFGQLLNDDRVIFKYEQDRQQYRFRRGNPDEKDLSHMTSGQCIKNHQKFREKVFMANYSDPMSHFLNSGDLSLLTIASSSEGGLSLSLTLDLE